MNDNFDVIFFPNFSLKPKIIWYMLICIVLVLFWTISFTSFSSKAHLLLPECAYHFFFKVFQNSLVILLLRRHAMPMKYYCQASLFYHLFSTLIFSTFIYNKFKHVFSNLFYDFLLGFLQICIPWFSNLYNNKLNNSHNSTIVTVKSYTIFSISITL